MKARLVSLNNSSKRKGYFVKHKDVYAENGRYGCLKKIKKDEFVQVDCGGAVTVTEVRTDIDTCEKVLVLQFYDSTGQLMEIEMSRKELTDSRILELVKFGVQVTKHSAVTLIKTIENSESVAPVSYQHTKLGFGYNEGKLIYKAQDAIGIRSKYAGNFMVQRKGKFAEYKKMLKQEVLGTPMEVVFVLALAAVSLDYLNEVYPSDNILVALTGNSTTGKSTALMLAVSLGASPCIGEESFMLSFLDTEFSLLHKIESSFPIGIDETSLLQKNSTRLLYALANGKERSRLHKDLSSAEEREYHTSIFMSGEQSILDMADEMGGLKARVMNFENVVWTKDARSAETIKRVCMHNYGFIIPKFAEYLLKKIDRDVMVESCIMKSEEFLNMQKDGVNNPLANRLAKKVGIALATAELAQEALGISCNVEYIMSFFVEHLTISDEDFDIGVKFYRILVSYIIEKPEMFGTNIYMPANINIQYYKKGMIKESDNVVLFDGSVSDTVLYISKPAFEELVKNAGFKDARVILRRLRDLQLLVCEKDRLVSKFKLGNEDILVKGYRIRIPTIDDRKELRKNVAQKEEDERKRAERKAKCNEPVDLEFDEEEED